MTLAQQNGKSTLSKTESFFCVFYHDFGWAFISNCPTKEKLETTELNNKKMNIKFF